MIRWKGTGFSGLLSFDVFERQDAHKYILFIESIAVAIICSVYTHTP